MFCRQIRFWRTTNCFGVNPFSQWKFKLCLEKVLPSKGWKTDGCAKGFVHRRLSKRKTTNKHGCLQENHRGIVPRKRTTCDRESDVSTKAKGLGGLLNFITGGSADVKIILNEPANGLATPSCSSPFNVVVIAQAKSEIKYNKVYLKVRGSYVEDSLNMKRPEGQTRIDM
eukprot:1145451-Prorocentrum_minimum.AAC.1